MLLLPVTLLLDAPIVVAARDAVGSGAVWHQIGPNPRPMEPSPLPIPRRKRVTEVPPPMPGAAPSATQSGTPAAAPARPATSRYARCLAAGETDLPAAITAARAWLAETPPTPAGAERGAAAQCLGQLLIDSGDYAGAETAFSTSAEQVPASEPAALSALQAMAGNAALAGGRTDAALSWFEKALAPASAATPAGPNSVPADAKPAPAAPTNEALGAIHIDRARALVAQNRLPEASGALEEAHRLAPNDPEGWLLSATLARRGKDLERAQRDIEVAASLASHGHPLGPQIGLEAGVIAMLDGREDAARKSWDSVLATAPGSSEAETAKGYLDQIGPAPTIAPAATAAPPAAPETPR